MPLNRSYVNGFEVVDRTSELMIIPNEWGLMQQMGIWEGNGVADATVQLEKIVKDAAVLVDKNRGERATVGKDYTREMRSFFIPHFPHDERITPRDIQGKRAFGSEEAETLAAVRGRKLERIRRNHAWTMEAARCSTIVTGAGYAPNGTISVNWYDEYGEGIGSRPTVDFELDTDTTEVLAKIENVIADAQDNLESGELINDIVIISSPEFFSKLISHPAVKNAYQYYTSSQEPLRNRLTGGPDVRYRDFVYGGVRFVEYRGSFNGSRLIPADKAYAVPTGVQDAFETYFAPAEKFDTVNTAGQEAYVFEWTDPKGEYIELQSESNFLNVLRRPMSVIECTA